jgi:hypothetical protein
MKTVRTAIALAAVGIVLCLWLLVRVSWYSFVAFMLLAQPLLLLAVLIFLGAVARDLKKKGLF